LFEGSIHKIINLFHRRLVPHRLIGMGGVSA
jgi:hypothetical protein